jgi:glycosyltransferase involved in cell wall biosynthesis
MLRETIRCLRQYTRHADTEFVVADDGSTDGTRTMLEAEAVPVVTGVNMGVAWNKNRVLYLLGQIRRCEVVIMLEDDTMPDRPGWEDAWIEAATSWGHVNYAAPWLADRAVSGQGLPADPFLATEVTAQCAAWTREALDWAGYFDSRFRGYGHEHVEHARRLIRAGYGGTDHDRVLFAAIGGGVTVHPAVSHGSADEVARNLGLAHQAMADGSWRAPWRNLAELKQFRSEIDRALAARPAGFALHRPAPPAPARRFGWLARLFRWRR